MACPTPQVLPIKCNNGNYSAAQGQTFKLPSEPDSFEQQTEESPMDRPQLSTSIMELSPLDQIMVRGIVRLILCFPVPDANNRPLIIETLKKGLNDTVRQMPYLSGSIRERPNKRREIELIFRHGEDIQLLVKDVGNDMPTYQELSNKQMPLSYFKDELLSPMRNMPESDRKLHPVMAAQANFLRGGLFLCVCFHHSVLDGAGFASLLEVLGRNCSNATIPEMFWAGEDSTERGGLFLNLDPTVNYKTDGYPEYFLEDPSSMVPPESGEEHPTTARLFYVRQSSLCKLKSSASPTDPTKWISTSNALGALVWRCVTRARSGRHSDQEDSKFCIFTDCRTRLRQYVGEDFIGNMCVGAQTQLPSAQVKHSTLPELAMKLRESLNGIDKDYVLGLIKHVKEYPGDLNLIKPGIHSYMGNDINMVSWTSFPVYEMDFGPILGKPEWFRCPWRTLDGTVKVLPEWKRPRPGSTEPGFEVNVELREDDMERLLKDPLWTSYAQEVLF